MFRQLSFNQIGPPAMLSRALAGISGLPHSSAVFCLPGSRNAVDLACRELIVPILPHLLSQLRR
jgi:molybdenum cofactor biosynthesis protein B